MDPLILSRIQFAANISFHILFPAITIALGWVLLFFKLRYNATSDTAWMRAYFTWVKVFALSFAMGVVSGVTMSFQFGTNWPGYMENRRQHRRPAAGLRGAHRLLPRGRVPRHHAVRLPPGFQPHPHLGDLAGCLRHHAVGLLDSGAEFLDADARPASRCATASPMPPTGGRSFSTRPSPIASSTCCLRPASRSPSSSPACRRCASSPAIARNRCGKRCAPASSPPPS